MTILKEGERVDALKYYSWGWNSREITTALLDTRREKIKVDMQREVDVVIAHRFNQVKEYSRPKEMDETTYHIFRDFERD